MCHQASEAHCDYNHFTKQLQHRQLCTMQSNNNNNSVQKTDDQSSEDKIQSPNHLQNTLVMSQDDQLDLPVVPTESVEEFKMIE